MIGNSSFFLELKECSSWYVTFGDGVKSKVIGKGSISQLGLPILQDVKLINGLFANLISINQLCDQGFSISFSKDNYEVMYQAKIL